MTLRSVPPPGVSALGNFSTKGAIVVNPAPWHVNPVSTQDDQKLAEIMAAREERTGEQVTKAGTIRHAVRRLWREEVEGGSESAR
jgi:hypothetical protein